MHFITLQQSTSAKSVLGLYSDYYTTNKMFNQNLSYLNLRPGAATPINVNQCPFLLYKNEHCHNLLSVCPSSMKPKWNIFNPLVIFIWCGFYFPQKCQSCLTHWTKTYWICSHRVYQLLKKIIWSFVCMFSLPSSLNLWFYQSKMTTYK